MPSDTSSTIQLAQVIAQVTAPSFLLGAVAAFISLLIARMNRIIDTNIERHQRRRHLQDSP